MTELMRRNGVEIAQVEAFDDLLVPFLKALDVMKSSKRTYLRALRRFFSWMEDRGIRRPTREDVIAYKRELMEESGGEEKKSPYTVSCYLTALRRFFSWTSARGIYPDVASGVKGCRKPRGFRRDVLTVDQARELLSKIPRETLGDKRDYALVNLLLRTALRTIEAVRANVGDIRQKGGEGILKIQGKGRDEKDEEVLLTPEVLEPLRDYLAHRGPVRDEDPLFASLSDRNRGGRLTTRSVSRIVKTRLRKIGLDDRRISAHSLRHTAITLSLLGGATLQEARLLGRHSDINTTLIYAHNIERFSHRAAERRISEVLAAV